MTLLSVDFHLTDHLLRLVTSFRTHVDSDAPVVVVQNADRFERHRLRRAGVQAVGFGLNIGHGLALDWGMRYVQTEYVIICDPDAVVISKRFREELISRLKRYGVCGIVISDRPEHRRYHPICLAFQTRLWKEGGWSLDAEDGLYRDVGWALTHRLGGLNEDAVLARTRGGWNGVVWAESFSNTYGTSRIRDMADNEVLDGCPVGHLRTYHRRWISWADEVAVGHAGVDDFPEPEPF